MEYTQASPRQFTMNTLRRILSIGELRLLLVLVVLVLIFNSKNGAMLTELNIRVTIRALAYAGIVAVGQTLLIIAGEIDLSVGSVAGLGAVMFGWMMKNWGWSIEASVIGGVLTGALMGLVNGIMAVKVRLPAFIATLSMLYVARGINYVVTEGYPVYPLPPAIGELGSARPLNLSWAVIIFLVLILIGDFIMRQTIFGSMITATGGNTRAARMFGINTGRVKMACFILTGMLAALSGMLVAASIKTGDPQIGQAWELDVIASVVIGGTSLLGGRGTLLGTLLGAIIMQVVRTGLVIIGVEALWQNVAIGAILIGVASADLISRGNRLRIPFLKGGGQRTA
ncbi:MAG: ABC transporter permease [Anaerolineae bacterium]|nr:ABC transporter permease [Anaerolineae bacterium]